MFCIALRVEVDMQGDWGPRYLFIIPTTRGIFLSRSMTYKNYWTMFTSVSVSRDLERVIVYLNCQIGPHNLFIGTANHRSGPGPDVFINARAG